MRGVSRDAVVDAAAYIDSWLSFRQRFDRIPGVQAAILHEGDVVLSAAHGLADIESATPLTPDHRFRIASHSKTFTATAIMRLVEQGRLRLDDPVAQWLGGLADTPLAAVRVRELLAHGAGVVRDGWDGDFWQLARVFPDHDTLLGIATDDASVLARNDRFKYSNIGYSLLGQVIESVTGQTYAEHVAEAILDPLGLAATAPDIDVADVTGHATGYTGLGYADRRLPIDHIATGAMSAATGFSSTAGDLVHYAAAHFLGDIRLLSDDSKRQMQRAEWAVEGASSWYGLGLAIAEIGTRRVVGHGGGFPGFITRTWWDPVDRLALAVLTNAIDGPALTLANGAIRLLDLALHPDGAGTTADDAETDAETGVDLGSYCGRFANLWGVIDVVALGGRLYLLDPTADDPVAAPARLSVVDERTLRITEAPGYASPGERLVYERDDDGRIRSMRGGSGSTSHPFDAVTLAAAGRRRVTLGQPLVP
ncbi:MAG: serine hydrolase domain-containing protein [Ilumatobacteraceae bacterium]